MPHGLPLSLNMVPERSTTSMTVGTFGTNIAPPVWQPLPGPPPLPSPPVPTAPKLGVAPVPTAPPRLGCAPAPVAPPLGLFLTLPPVPPLPALQPRMATHTALPKM